MKLTEVSRSVGRKINMGNYETLDLFCSVKAEVDETDSVEDVSKMLMSIAWKEINEDAAKIKKTIRKEGE